MTRSTIGQALLAGALGLTLGCAAHAQDAAAAGSSDEDTSTPNQTVTSTENGEQVVVVAARKYVPTGAQTANKSDIPLIQTPQSITVVTRDQIDLLNFIDGQQAVRYTSGVQGENYGPDLRFDFISVRGFTPKQYIDGLAAPISTTIYSVGVDLYAFESMDILKGPASVLYGNAPPGGIYNQTSRRPSSAFGGELAAQLGTTEYKQVAGTVTGSLSDNVSARMTALYRDRDADRDGVSLKRALAAPAVTFDLGENTKLTALGYFQHDKVDGDTNGFLPAVGTLLPNPLGQISRGTNLGEPDYNEYKRDQYAIGYDLSHSFSSAMTFHSNTKYSHYKESSLVIYGAGLGADNRTESRFNFPYHETVKSIATDNRVDLKMGSGNVEHELLAGVDYRNVENLALYGFGGASSIDIFDPVYDVGAPFVTPDLAFTFNDQRLKQTGLYAQDHIGVNDHLFFTLGARQDYVNIRNRATDDTTKQDKLTWRAGVNYILDNGFAPYIGYAKSFEPVLGVDTITGEDFKPSSGKQIEGGIKYDARGLSDDVKLFASLAGFKITQTNVVGTVSSQTPVGGTQSGEVEVKGAELEVVMRLWQQLSINASYSYIDSEVTKNPDFPDAVGARLTTTPKNKLSFFTDYTIKRGMLGGLGFGAGLRHAGKSPGAIPGPFSGPILLGEDPTLFDAIVHYDTPDWRFAVNGSNIFDKRYVARCASLSNCNFGASRQVIATLTKKF
jgi:iron complex outermembrane receptor protein